MTSFSTLSEFLLQSGSNFLIFDLGRGIHRLSGQSLLNIETQQVPAPFPRQQQLWLGIVFWDPSRSQQQFIWFLKFPLDEQGLMQTAARDHFLSLVLEALSKTLEQKDAAVKLDIADNPYGFQPPQQLMADFNAVSKVTLGQQPSEFYQSVVNFLTSYQVSDWQTLGLQGVSDFVARLSQQQNTETLTTAFPELPQELQHKLCASMEHQTLPQALEAMVCEWTQTQDVNSDNQLFGLRALSQSNQAETIKHLLASALAQEPSLDTFSTIAARHWQRFNDYELLIKFFESLANADLASDVFTGFYQDLVQLPTLRKSVLALRADKSLSGPLQQALQGLRGAS